jgi:hypothetical protein
MVDKRLQQNLCLRHSSRSTHSNAYADRNASANTNSYAVTRREPYAHAESDTAVAPDSAVASDASLATVDLCLAVVSSRFVIIWTTDITEVIAIIDRAVQRSESPFQKRLDQIWPTIYKRRFLHLDVS